VKTWGHEEHHDEPAGFGVAILWENLWQWYGKPMDLQDPSEPSGLGA